MKVHGTASRFLVVLPRHPLGFLNTSIQTTDSLDSLCKQNKNYFAVMFLSVFCWIVCRMNFSIGKDIENTWQGKLDVVAWGKYGNPWTKRFIPMCIRFSDWSSENLGYIFILFHSNRILNGRETQKWTIFFRSIIRTLRFPKPKIQEGFPSRSTISWKLLWFFCFHFTIFKFPLHKVAGNSSFFFSRNVTLFLYFICN